MELVADFVLEEIEIAASDRCACCCSGARATPAVIRPYDKHIILDLHNFLVDDANRARPSVACAAGLVGDGAQPHPPTLRRNATTARAAPRGLLGYRKFEFSGRVEPRAACRRTPLVGNLRPSARSVQLHLGTVAKLIRELA